MPGDTDDAASMTPNCWRGPHGDSKRKEKEAPRRQSLGPPAAASSVLQLWACFACTCLTHRIMNTVPVSAGTCGPFSFNGMQPSLPRL